MPPDAQALAQLLAERAQPLFAGDAVGAELFEPVLFFAVEECPVRAQLAGGRGVEHVARVVRAHLEEHPHLELAEDLVREIAIQVVHRVAPGDQVDAQDGPFAQDRVELVGGSRLLRRPCVRN